MSKEVEVGKLAYLKTTGEPVFVLGKLPDSPGELRVRRPVNTRDGIYHEKEIFYVEELETYQSKVEREVEELQYGRDLVLASKTGAAAPPKDLVN